MKTEFFAEIKMLPEEASGSYRDTDAWQVHYIIIGAGTKRVGYNASTFANGEVIVVPPTMPVDWEFKSNVTDKNGKISAIIIKLEKDFLDQCATAFPELHEIVDKWHRQTRAIKLSYQLSSEVIPLLQQMAKMSPAERSAAIIDLIILLGNRMEGSVLAETLDQDTQEQAIDKACNYIKANARRNLRLKEVVNYMGMNRTDFCNFFKLETGETFITYLKKHRLKLTCEMLEQTSTPISEICFSAGFENIPYFNHLFKKTFGISPSEYREKAQSKKG